MYLMLIILLYAGVSFQFYFMDLTSPIGGGGGGDRGVKVHKIKLKTNFKIQQIY